MAEGVEYPTSGHITDQANLGAEEVEEGTALEQLEAAKARLEESKRA